MKRRHIEVQTITVPVDQIMPGDCISIGNMDFKYRVYTVTIDLKYVTITLLDTTISYISRLYSWPVKREVWVDDPE